jgi:hypothetical protein
MAGVVMRSPWQLAGAIGRAQNRPPNGKRARCSGGWVSRPARPLPVRGERPLRLCSVSEVAREGEPGVSLTPMMWIGRLLLDARRSGASWRDPQEPRLSPTATLRGGAVLP